MRGRGLPGSVSSIADNPTVGGDLTVGGTVTSGGLEVDPPGGFVAGTGYVAVVSAAQPIIYVSSDGQGSADTFVLFLANDVPATALAPKQDAGALSYTANVWDGTTTRYAIWDHLAKTTSGASYTTDFLFRVSLEGIAEQTTVAFLGRGGIKITNRTTVPAAPVGAATVYADGGATKVVDPGGARTTIAGVGAAGGGTSNREIGFGSPYGVVTTTGAATGDVCASAALPASCTFTVEVTIQGRETTTGNIASTTYTHRGRTDGSAVPTLVGTATVLGSMAAGSDAALATATSALATSGSTIKLQATGVAATVIVWLGKMNIIVN